jgi:uncharacterized protein YbjT (DUF2867 family)
VSERILVAGATGYLGRRLVPRLVAAGHVVTALVRGGAARAARLPHLAGARPVDTDVREATACREAAEGATAVVNLVGIVREGRGATFEEMHVGATRNLVAAAQAAGARRFLYVSAIGARADAPTLYWRTKAKAEAIVRGSGMEWMVLRPSIVFARDGEFFGILRQLTAVPLVPILGAGTSRMAPVRADDLADVQVAAFARPDAWRRVHEVAGPDAFTFEELVRRVARGLGRKIVCVHVPLALVRPALALLAPVEGWLPITRDQFAMLEEDSLADPAPVAAAFGVTVRPLDPIIDGKEDAP